MNLGNEICIFICPHPGATGLCCLVSIGAVDEFTLAPPKTLGCWSFMKMHGLFSMAVGESIFPSHNLVSFYLIAMDNLLSSKTVNISSFITQLHFY